MVYASRWINLDSAMYWERKQILFTLIWRTDKGTSVDGGWEVALTQGRIDGRKPKETFWANVKFCNLIWGGIHTCQTSFNWIFKIYALHVCYTAMTKSNSWIHKFGKFYVRDANDGHPGHVLTFMELFSQHLNWFWFHRVHEGLRWYLAVLEKEGTFAWVCVKRLVGSHSYLVTTWKISWEKHGRPSLLMLTSSAREIKVQCKDESHIWSW